MIIRAGRFFHECGLNLASLMTTTTAVIAVIASAASAQIPTELDELTFGDIQPIESSSSENGFTERFWKVGDRIEDILQLGDLLDTDLPGLNLRDILNGSLTGTAGVLLADFPLLSELSLSELVSAIPSLENLELAEVKPLYDLVATAVSSSELIALATSEIGEIIEAPFLGDLSLGDLNLSHYSLTQIPHLLNTPLQSFPHWASQSLHQIPGLTELPWGTFMNLLTEGLPVAKVDLILNETEGYIGNTISGSYAEGFGVACHQDDCFHIELSDGIGLWNGYGGKRWVGKSQEVKGGSGCLVGKEPTGRHPFGSRFKVVLTGVDEAEPRADFSLYFRFCVPFCECSPYVIGPFPFFSVTEKEPLIIGY